MNWYFRSEFVTNDLLIHIEVVKLMPSILLSQDENSADSAIQATAVICF